MNGLFAKNRIVFLIVSVLLIGCVLGIFLSACENTPEIPEPEIGVWNDGGDVPYTSLYAQEISRYTCVGPSYHLSDKSERLPAVSIVRPRYTLFGDHYKREDAQASGEAVLMLTGDLMCQTRQQAAAFEKYGVYDFHDSFTEVEKIFKTADLVVGNLEATVYDKAPYMSEINRVDGKIYVNAPSSFLDALKYAGYDLLMNANNHCCDTGLPGLFDTLNSLDRYGFMHTGTFTPDVQQRFLLVDVNGIRIAFLAYSTFFNGRDNLIYPSGQKRFLNRFSYERAREDVAAARAAGAEFVLSYIHWGTEYSNKETDSQRRNAQRLADAGVDYIVGSHSHTLQRYDVLTAADGRRVPVIYSLGNFMSHQQRTITRDALILRLKLIRTSGGIRTEDSYIPCVMLEQFKDCSFVVKPLSAPENESCLYYYLADKRIAGVLGGKIKKAEEPY